MPQRGCRIAFNRTSQIMWGTLFQVPRWACHNRILIRGPTHEEPNFLSFYEEIKKEVREGKNVIDKYLDPTLNGSCSDEKLGSVALGPAHPGKIAPL